MDGPTDLLNGMMRRDFPNPSRKSEKGDGRKRGRMSEEMEMETEMKVTPRKPF